MYAADFSVDAFWKGSQVTATSSRIQEFRDRQDNICPACGKPMLPGEPVDIDHVFSRARHGMDHPDNYQLLHASCNRSKGKGSKEGGVGSSKIPFTRSDIESIAQRISEVEGAAEAQVARKIDEWARSIGLRPRPANGKTGGVYYDWNGGNASVQVVSLWGKGTIQLHLKDMRNLGTLPDQSTLAAFVDQLVLALPRLGTLRGIANFNAAKPTSPEVYVWTFLDESRQGVDENSLVRFFAVYEAALR